MNLSDETPGGKTPSEEKHDAGGAANGRAADGDNLDRLKADFLAKSAAPSANGNGQAPKSAEVNAVAPCRVCGATSGCRVDEERHKVACLNKDGPFAKKSTIKETGQECFAHEFDDVTGRVFEAIPEETARFLSAIFADKDVVLNRPTEAWTEGGKKKSRVIYDATLHVTAASMRTNPRWWTRLLWAAEAERANLFFGVCPRFGGQARFDLAWQIRTVRALWADLDHCTPDEALKRCEAAGLAKPSIVVRSGHGVHLYWLLAEPYLIDDAGDPPPVDLEWIKQAEGKPRPRKYVKDADGEVHYLYQQDPKTGLDSKTPNPAFPFKQSDKTVRVQDVLSGIAAQIKGDHTTDVCRLLRLPGTLNQKGARNKKAPTPCSLVEFEPNRRYPIADFERFAAASPVKVKRENVAKVRLPAGGRFTGKRLDRLNDHVNACNLAQVGDRSQRDFHLCAWSVEQGLDKERVWAEVEGVGKFAEKGRGYFDRTWAAAEGKTREKIYDRYERKAGAKPSVNGATPETQEADSAEQHSQGGTTYQAGGDDNAGSKSDENTAEPTATDANEAINEPHRLGRLWLRAHATHPQRWRTAFYREQIHFWTGTHWAAQPDAEIKAELSRFCKKRLDIDNAIICKEWHSDKPPPKVPKVTTALVGNVVLAVAGDTLIPLDIPQPWWLGDAPGPRNWISLHNGTLDVDAFLSGGASPLGPHSPLWFSPTCLPYSFDPLADCPRWRAFLGKNLGDEPGKADLLQEWAGYTLCHNTSLQKMLMMVGEGANGKSVVCAVFVAMLGVDNVSTVPLEHFGDRFRLVGTLGKLVNLMAEVGEIDKVAEGQLKAFVVGDPIEVERKHKQPFTTTPTARIMLATNNPPQFNDKTDGIWRRVLLLPFIVQIPEAEQVRGMDKPEFWRKAGELPGILNWALAGLHRLHASKGRFTVPQSCREAAEKLRVDSNPARRFLQEHYEENVAGRVFKADLYRTYVNWCKGHGHHPLAEIGFGREVMRAFKAAKSDKSGPNKSDGKRFPIYTGFTRRADVPTWASTPDDEQP